MAKIRIFGTFLFVIGLINILFSSSYHSVKPFHSSCLFPPIPLDCIFGLTILAGLAIMIYSGMLSDDQEENREAS